MGEETNVSIGETPYLKPHNLKLGRAFNLETGEWVMHLTIIDDGGKRLTVALSHEAYHSMTSFLVEHDDDLYNHKDQH